MLLFAGYLSHDGTVEAVTAYGGWFLVAYSAIAYAGSGTLFLLRRSDEFWKTLYPVNFSLALAALSLFGLHSRLLVPMLLATALLGLISGAILYQSGTLNFRVIPLALLSLLLLCFVPSITTRWMFVLVFVAAVLLGCFMLTRLRGDVRQQRL